MPKKQKDLPVHEVRFRTIKAAIWRNETDKGIRHNVTFSRSYKDDEDKWHSTDSFGREDLLLVAKTADLAHSWIHAEDDKERAKEKAGEGEPAPAEE